MAVTGRPKAKDPYIRKVSAKYRQEEYDVVLEFAKKHNLTISQLVRMGIETVMNQHKDKA